MWRLQIRRLTKGYTAKAEEQGYQHEGTVFLSTEDIQQLLQHLPAQQTKTSGSAKLVYIRDSLAITHLWHFTIRGFNAGSTRLHDIKLTTNKSAVLFLTLK